jgi:hypothetical protein
MRINHGVTTRYIQQPRATHVHVQQTAVLASGNRLAGSSETKNAGNLNAIKL